MERNLLLVRPSVLSRLPSPSPCLHGLFRGVSYCLLPPFSPSLQMLMFREGERRARKLKLK